MFAPDLKQSLSPGRVRVMSGHMPLPTHHTRVSSLCCPLSGSPCRLPPGGAGQLRARVHLLHPGHLRVCGSALYPHQRTEVHHLRHLSAPRMWVFSFFFFFLDNFLSLCISPDHVLTDVSFPPGLCIMIAASIYTDRFHIDEKDGWYGHSYILAWIAFGFTFISSITYFVLRKKTAWEGH